MNTEHTPINDIIAPMPTAYRPVNEIADLLAWLDFAEPQSHRHITVIPILRRNPHGLAYLSMGQAMECNALEISEISINGSVPELKAINRGALPVLLLDGEELRGAKQNRVLNTSILLKERSETIIPVSCTEQGRWRYSSSHFAESKVVMDSNSRASKINTVSDWLSKGAHYQSDQSQVWSDVAALHEHTGTVSSSSALSDAYDSHEDQLAECVQAFPLRDTQCGLVVFTRGRLIGFDYISRHDVYARLHGILLKSYTIEALFEPGGRSIKAEKALKAAKNLLARTVKCASQRFPSIGYGESIRLKSPELTGAALVHDQQILHAAVFQHAPRAKARYHPLEEG